MVWKLRRVLSGLAADGNAAPGLELLMDRLKTFRTNDEFLNEIAKQPSACSARCLRRVPVSTPIRARSSASGRQRTRRSQLDAVAVEEGAAELVGRPQVVAVVARRGQLEEVVVGVDGHGVAQDRGTAARRTSSRRRRRSARRAGRASRSRSRTSRGLSSGVRMPRRVERSAGERHRWEPSKRRTSSVPSVTQLVDEEVGRHRDHERALALDPGCRRARRPPDRAGGRPANASDDLRRREVGPQLVDGAGEALRVELACAEAGLQRVQRVEVAGDLGQLQAGRRRRQQRAVEVEHVQGTSSAGECDRCDLTAGSSAVHSSSELTAPGGLDG